MHNAIKVEHFMNSSFKEFSLADNIRSIPTITDGLKPSQRKAVYGMQLRGETAGEIQVERVAAQIAADTDYHHGTTSMESTIIGMANNYTGTNNINLFEPSGQFGSRLTKSAAASRYIFTKMSKNFRMVYKKEDDSILENIIVDGEKIEPKTYVPLIPMVLVNGSMGTGTGYASYVMNYNPKQIVDNIIRVLNAQSTTAMTPWYRGFSGSITRNPENGQVEIRGILEVVNSTTIHITELPVGVYLDQYKDHLAKLEDSGFIKDYEDISTEEGFDFQITCPRSTTALPHETLMQKFKLISRDTENYTLWNEHGRIEVFESPTHIVERFVAWRLERYEERRQKLIADTEAEIAWLNERMRFIKFYLNNVDEFRNKNKKDLIELLLDNKFLEYDRLLQMAIWNLTKEKIDELIAELKKKDEYLQFLNSITAKQMYENELQELKEKL
jgi:DNA topoisomerase-2